MKKNHVKHTLLLVVAMMGWCIPANAQTDVTSTYLQNVGFDVAPITFTVAGGTTANAEAVRIGTTGYVYTIPNWTNASVVGNNAVQLASGEYGGVANSNGFNGVTPPATDKAGLSAGACLHMSAGWGDDAIITQSVTLPEGRYALKLDAYNAHTTTGCAVNFCGFVPTSGTAVYSTLNTFPNATWVSDSIYFNLVQETTGVISIGFTTSTGGSGNGAKLFIDNVRLEYYGVLVDKTNLQALVDSATTIYTAGVGNGLSDLNIAITAAQAILDNTNATALQVANAETAMQEAITAYYNAQNLMLGWDANGAMDKTPYDAGWRSSDEGITNWKVAGPDGVALDAASYQFRDNLGVGRAFIHPHNNARFTYPVSLQEGKTYQLTCSSSKMSGEGTRPVTMSVNTAIDASGVTLGQDVTPAAKWGSHTDHSFAFAASTTAVHYFIWQTADGGGDDRSLAYGFTLTETGDAVKLTFNVNGGSAIAPQYVVSGTAAVSPADPTKADYVFGGWYSDESCETEYDFATLITENKTIYAKWNAEIDAARDALTARAAEIEAMDFSNVGDNAFNKPTAAKTTLDAAVLTAKNYVGSTSSDYETALATLNAAVDAYNAVALVQPSATQAYSLVLNGNGGWTYDGMAATWSNDRADAGYYNMRYTTILAPVDTTQCFYFVAQADADCYKIKFMDATVADRYICTGVLYGGNATQIRTTDAAESALVVKVKYSAGYYQLYNTEASINIGSQDAGVFTTNGNSNFQLLPVTLVSISTSLSTEEASAFTAVVTNRTLSVSGVTCYEVYNVQGMQVASRMGDETVQLQQGVYLVKANGAVCKVLVK